MTTTIRNTARGAPRIVDKSARQQRLNVKTVADELGGQPIGRSLGKDNSPFSLYFLRDQISKCLVSSGGRPSLVGTRSKVKIACFESDWPKLEQLAQTASVGLRMRPSPAQMAALLLHEVLAQWTDEKLLALYDHAVAGGADETGYGHGRVKSTTRVD